MLRYLKNVVTLELDEEKCIGCGMCINVCPHAVFEMKEKKASIRDRDACMECGACVGNCPVNALKVRTGVGCASGILMGMLGKENDCSCGCGVSPEDNEQSTCSGAPQAAETTSCCGGSADETQNAENAASCCFGPKVVKISLKSKRCC